MFSWIHLVLRVSVIAALLKLDSVSYSQEVSAPTFVNFFRYNADSSNTMSHGSHFRGTHFLINLPLLYSPFIYPAILQGLRTPEIRWMIVASGLSVAALSIVPHQEPRFLIPFSFLAAVLLRDYLKPQRTWQVILHSIVLTAKKWLSVIWSSSLAFFFGFLHQSQVLGTIFAMNTMLPIQTQAICFFGTYPPPFSLLRVNPLIRYSTSRFSHSISGI
jgi:GPI mannosyltransferase 4